MLVVLKKLPIASRNSIVKLEEMVVRMSDAEVFGDETAALAAELVESWSGLQTVYKIPKRAAVILDTSTKKSPDSVEQVETRSIIPQKRNRQDEDQERKAWRSSSGSNGYRERDRDRDYDSSQRWKPDDSRVKSPPASWTPGSRSQDLPAGWSIAYTPNGSLFYCNDETRETSWTPPREKPAVAVVTAKPSLIEGISEDALLSIVQAATEATKKLEEDAAKELKMLKKKKHEEKKERQREKLLKKAGGSGSQTPSLLKESPVEKPSLEVTEPNLRDQNGWAPKQLKKLKAEVFISLT